MKKYIILCCLGTGGLFLTSVFAKILGCPIQSSISCTGHAHDMGKGNWKGNNSVCLIGDHWKINYRPGFTLYYTHQIPNDFLKKNHDIKLVQITTDPVDYRKVTELYVKKAWPDLWSKEEYKKWVGPDYPPYSPDNIRDSELIVNDLINDFEHSTIAAWHNLNKDIFADYQINFRTIMGIDNNDLVDVVSDIVEKTATDQTRQYVKDYQLLNQSLYFENYL